MSTVPAQQPGNRSDFILDGGILAGGMGSRFGGKDKGLIPWQQETLVKPIVDCLRPHVNHLYISCNRNLDTYRQYCDGVIADESQDFLGPLAGLLALLEASSADYMIISPCDTPLLPQVFVPRMRERLQQHLQASDNAGAVPIGVENGERHHPLHLLLPTSLKHSIRATLAAGDRKMMRWLFQHQPVWVDFSDEALGFANVNDPQAMEELTAKLGPGEKS